jgi:protein tyrosine/serine phosphatase
MWIDLEGLANLRDVGGMPTSDGGEIATGRLLRSDNLQGLTPVDVDRLLDLGLTDVVDLRSEYEVESEGPGPLSGHPEVHIHQHSLFREWREGIGEDKPDVRPDAVPDEALPWVDLTPTVTAENPVASIYLSYLADRPDSVLASLRHIGESDGATLVHCAAGKDRTGTIVAMALSVAGADRDAIIADYAASTERMEAILERLLGTRTYAENLRDRPMSSHATYPETMQVFLDFVDSEYGGAEPLLGRMGWTDADSARLKAKLRG